MYTYIITPYSPLAYPTHTLQDLQIELKLTKKWHIEPPPPLLDITTKAMETVTHSLVKKIKLNKIYICTIFVVVLIFFR